jgi:putative membrane protein
MFEIAIRVIVNAIALVAAVRLVPGAEFRGDWPQLIVLAAIFGLINAYLRPVLKLFALPLNLLTLGAVSFVINAGLVMLAAAISDNLRLGFSLAGWPPGPIDLDVLIAAFLTSIVISVVSSLIAFVRLATPRL